MKGDWTTQPETSAEQREQLELEKVICSGNGRDSSIKLVIVTLRLAHKERTEMGLFVDLLERCLALVCHASELELLNFSKKIMRDDLKLAEDDKVLQFLELFAHRVFQQAHAAATDAQKLAQLIHLAREPD